MDPFSFVFIGVGVAALSMLFKSGSSSCDACGGSGRRWDLSTGSTTPCYCSAGDRARQVDLNHYRGW